MTGPLSSIFPLRRPDGKPFQSIADILSYVMNPNPGAIADNPTPNIAPMGPPLQKVSLPTGNARMDQQQGLMFDPYRVMQGETPPRDPEQNPTFDERFKGGPFRDIAPEPAKGKVPWNSNLTGPDRDIISIDTQDAPLKGVATPPKTQKISMGIPPTKPGQELPSVETPYQQLKRQEKEMNNTYGDSYGTNSWGDLPNEVEDSWRSWQGQKELNARKQEDPALLPTKIATLIPSVIPIVPEKLQSFISAGDEPEADTLAMMRNFYRQRMAGTVQPLPIQPGPMAGRPSAQQIVEGKKQIKGGSSKVVPLGNEMDWIDRAIKRLQDPHGFR